MDGDDTGKILMSRHSRGQSYSAVKIPRFCEPCNYGWMSQIENRACDVVTLMIYGQRVGLTDRDLDAPARWLYLKTLVSDLIDHGYPTAGAEDFRWFYEHREVPDHFTARVGYFDHTKRDVFSSTSNPSAQELTSLG